MAIYTFYMSRGDAGATTFEAFDRAGDESAGECALRMLVEHPSSAFVSVWCGEREVLTRFRHAPAGASTGGAQGVTHAP